MRSSSLFCGLFSPVGVWVFEGVAEGEGDGKRTRRQRGSLGFLLFLSALPSQRERELEACVHNRFMLLPPLISPFLEIHSYLFLLSFLSCFITSSPVP